MEDLRLKGFKVHELPVAADIPVSSGRRDFYKMGLVSGDMTIHYGDKLLEINDTVLFLSTPMYPGLLSAGLQTQPVMPAFLLQPLLNKPRH